MRLSRSFVLAACTLTASACTDSETPPSLGHGLRSVSSFEVDAGDTPSAALTRAADQLAERLRSDPAYAGATLLGRSARILLRRAEESMPAFWAIEGGPNGLRVFGVDCDGELDAVVATFEDPERSGLPLTLVVAHRDDVLVQLARRIAPAQEAGVSLWLEGAPAWRVKLDAAGVPREETRRELQSVEVPWERVVSDGPREQGELEAIEVALDPRIDQSTRAVALSRAHAARAAAHRWLGLASDSPGPVLYVHRDVASLTSFTGDERGSFVGLTGSTAHGVAGPGSSETVGEVFATATALRSLGPPAVPWFADALGLAASGSYHGVALADWCRFVAGADSFTSLAEDVLRSPSPPRSVHETRPMRAAFVAWLAETRGPQDLRRIWTGEMAVPIDTWGQNEFAAWLGPDGGERALGRGRVPRERLAGPWRGAALVRDERVPGAFGPDPRAGAVLAELALAGANAFSFTIPTSSAPRIWADRLVGSAFSSTSDLAIAGIAELGLGSGLETVLVLEPRAHPRGGAADAIHINRTEGVRALFDGLEPVVRHYALLAELSGAAGLVLGSELDFAACTLAAEGAPWREQRQARWTRLIGVARASFGGFLTYAARGPETIYQTDFWSDLDFVAAHLYPDLSPEEGADASTDSPSDELLASRWYQRLGDLARLAEERGRPLFVLQAGFPARSGSWDDPRFPRGNDDPKAQGRAFAGLADGLARLGDEAPAGLFLWRLESSPTSSSATDYLVRGRPAEASVPRILQVR